MSRAHSPPPVAPTLQSQGAEPTAQGGAWMRPGGEEGEENDKAMSCGLEY